MRSIQLLERSDERAVSPVIGVILMVAITVILSATIGVFVLGLNEQVGDSTPQATIGASVSAANDEVTLDHEGGDSIQADETRLVVKANGTTYNIAASSSDVLFRTGGEAVISDDGTDVGIDWDNDGTYESTTNGTLTLSEGDEVEITIVDTASERAIASFTVRA